MIKTRTDPRARKKREREEVLRKLATHPELKKKAPKAFKIAVMIYLRINHETETAYPSIARLVKDSGETRVTVMRSLKALWNTGHLKWWQAKPPNGPRKVNHYMFVLNPDPTSITGDTSEEASTSITRDTSQEEDDASTGITTVTSSARATGITRDTPTSITGDTGTGITRDTQNPKEEPRREPTGGAAPHAPASPSQHSVPSTADASALRAADAASGVRDVSLELASIFSLAEAFAAEDPTLLHPDFDPSTSGLTAGDAERYFATAYCAEHYAAEAQDLQDLLRACTDLVTLERAERARIVLTNKARLSEHVAQLAREASPVFVVPARPSLDDEVPF